MWKKNNKLVKTLITSVSSFAQVSWPSIMRIIIKCIGRKRIKEVIFIVYKLHNINSTKN